MDKKGWKIFAIISIVVNILLISGFFWGLSSVNESIENDNFCYYDFCDVDNDESPAYMYIYDEYEKVCTCYNEYNEIIQETYLG